MSKNLTLTIVLVAIGISTNLYAAQSAPSLLGHWEFTKANIKENKVCDKFRIGPAKILGPVKLSKEQGMEALVLDGKTSVTISNKIKSVPLPVREMTVSAWVYISKEQESGGIVGVFSSNSKNKTGWLLGYRNNLFRFGVADKLVGRMFDVYSENKFELNKWYHVAGTFDGEQKKIYVNGQLENMSKSGRYDIGYPNIGVYTIGAYRKNTKNIPIEGMIREVKVYNRALSQGEIRRNLFIQNYPIPMIIAGPWLQHSTKTSQAIMWETNEPGTSMVEYGEKFPLEFRQENKELKVIHELTLPNLKPQTKYFYRISSQTKTTNLAAPTLTFQTAVKDNSAYSFVVMGDSFTWVPDYERKRIFDLAWAERPNFVLHVGDVVPQGKIREQWAREWLCPAGELMSRIPMYVAMGNHELLGRNEQNRSWFYSYVSYPKPENFYSFDYGNAHIAVIDSNQRKEIAPGGKQYEWLDKDLAKSNAKWKFVIFHHPPYCSDDDDFTDTWKKGQSHLGDLHARKLAPLFEKHKVAIVWSGHIHLYERTWPLTAGNIDQKNGVIYVKTGGGGSDLEEFSPVRSWFSAKLMRNWHYCLVNIYEGTLNMMVYNINGNMVDILKCVRE